MWEREGYGKGDGRDIAQKNGSKEGIAKTDRETDKQKYREKQKQKDKIERQNQKERKNREVWSERQKEIPKETERQRDNYMFIQTERKKG